MARNKNKIIYFVFGLSLWYYLGTYDREHLKKLWYVKGLNVSQKFKPYPAWDAYVEPFIIKQFSLLFSAGNSFINGMTSDNTSDISADITTYVKNVETDLRAFDENKN